MKLSNLLIMLWTYYSKGLTNYSTIFFNKFYLFLLNVHLKLLLNLGSNYFFIPQDDTVL